MLKKILVAGAAALVLAPVFASADTTLYGSLRMEYDFVSPDGGDDFDKIQNRSSRIGVKFDQKWGKNKVFGKAEFAIDKNSYDFGGKRYMYLGVEGAFGTALAGRAPAPYYTYVLERADFWNGNYSSYSTIDPTGDKAPNAIAYITPDFGGFTAAVAMVTLNGTYVDANKDTVDEDNSFHIAAGYASKMFNVGVSYQNLNSKASEMSAIGIGGDVTFSGFTLGATYESGDDDLDDNEALNVYAKYKMGSTVLMAGYGNEEEGEDDYDTFSLGVQHNFTKTFRVYAEYNTKDDVQDAVMLGARLDF